MPSDSSDVAPPSSEHADLTPLAAALIGVPKKTFQERFSMHTERGAALNAAATVDEELGEALGKHMIDSSLKASVFREGAALGNFGTRIRIAYLLGIVSKRLFQELEIVREVRNKFAHRKEIQDFLHPEIAQQCDKFTLIPEILSLSPEFFSQHFGDVFNEFDLRQNTYKFMATCSMLQAAIGIESGHAFIRKPTLLTAA